MCKEYRSLFYGYGMYPPDLTKPVLPRNSNFEISFKVPLKKDDMITRYNYFWFDRDGTARHKARYLPLTDGLPPAWSFDGSSTGMRDVEESDVRLIPVRTYGEYVNVGTKDHVVDVLCMDDVSLQTRALLDSAAKVAEEYEVWLGLEQEFYTSTPWGVQNNKNYCSVSESNEPEFDCFIPLIRELLDKGLHISGYNMEVAVNQHEIQLGTYKNDVLKCADDLLYLRYKLNVLIHNVTFDPKPFPEWNGSGCHLNFSTKEMRETFNYYDASNALRYGHSDFMLNSGDGNERRMIGECETSEWAIFTYSKHGRNTSVKQKHGYLEDRRPGANVNPYIYLQRLLTSLETR